jgi:hypothetical protein
MSESPPANGGAVPSPRENGDRRVAGEGPPSEPQDENSPEVPGFRSWRSIYWFVFVSFVAVVVALTIFSRVYA